MEKRLKGTHKTLKKFQADLKYYDQKVVEHDREIMKIKFSYPLKSYFMQNLHRPKSKTRQTDLPAGFLY